ncbi:Cleavage polyadenylation factor subunit clp1 [Coemansia javaensis]|uniref:Polynucleotide 5'-hydroxyl-kinase GRC3 n=1 Tax=Coemansia javaensis TaxID=2761396 RepID=A0A9W8LI44_9FUNG|nr:Cleavage polyadenylation factor subunit clp1 [Coemansia javaensis]
MADTAREWVLKAGEELRFEVDFRRTVSVRLRAGHAEYFGAELGPEATYEFSGENGAIFSWEGCTLAVAGECASAYVAGETPMVAYINVHMALQQQRRRQGAAPRVMVVGPADCGKTSLARLLLNYAARQGEAPLFVDLDPASASVTVPGTLSATAITKTVDIECGFMGHAASSSAGPPEAPLVWHFGHEDPAANPRLFCALVDRAAAAVDRRLAADARAGAAGIVVDTRGSSDAGRDPAVLHAIEALRINVLAVVGNERMYSALETQLAGRGIAVLRLPRSGGAVDRSPAFRQLLNAKVVRQYFYGTPRDEAASFSTVVNFDDIAVLRVGEDAVAPSSTLPLGEARRPAATTVVPVALDESLVHSILAVTDAPRPASDDDDATAAEKMAVDAPADALVGIQAIGFVSVTRVEMDRRRLIVVSPVAGRLQKHVLLHGDTKWMETA